jgi:hypothetical protein
MWTSGGQAPGSSSVPTRTKAIAAPPPAKWLHSASLQAGQRITVCPLPLSLGVRIASGLPASSSSRSLSIIAFTANALPLSRWHQVQWQQCTIIGGVVMR